MSNEHGLILPVIMCGGSGTRLWPASRESMPKQFIPLLGDHSTFQAAAQARRRSFDLPQAARHRQFGIPASSSPSNWRRSGLPPTSFWSRCRRDSAAAVAVATVRAAHEHPDAIVLIMAADHVIGDPKASRKPVGSPRGRRLDGHIMTFGIAPTSRRPAMATSPRGPRSTRREAIKVERFIEKPDANAAAKYIGQGYLWNGGYFLFAPQVMHAELGRFAPEILEAATSALAAASIDLDFIRLDKAAFERSPKTSIDYAVIEKTQLAGVLPVSFSWSDVGSWDAVWNVADRR